MLEVRVVRTLSIETGAALGHLSAASGLVQARQRLFVVADDEHMLAVFDLSGERAGRLQRLFAGELPDKPKARKAAKPDLEALAHLPPWPGCPHGALLALGASAGRCWRSTRRVNAMVPCARSTSRPCTRRCTPGTHS